MSACRDRIALFLASALIILGFGMSVRAADYLLDPNYAGVDGAPFGGYAGAYKSIVAALSNDSAVQVPNGASATMPNRIILAPGTYNTAYDTGVTLVNLRSNIALWE